MGVPAWKYSMKTEYFVVGGEEEEEEQCKQADHS